MGGGRIGASGGGRADGGLVRPLGERCDPFGPRFDQDVEPGGYRWWYLDAESDDGQFGLTVIAFIGSVFSPYYKASGRGRPEDHVSLNVALYGPKGKRWAQRWTMTERGEKALWRDTRTLRIGPSQLHWDGEALVIDVHEVNALIPLPVRGRIRLVPQVLGQRRFRLDPSGKHVWEPLAPRARVEVHMTDPDVRWSGTGYLDANHGSEALEDGFADWQWSRAHLANGDTAVIYEGKLRSGEDFGMALRIGTDGNAEVAEMPAAVTLPRTLWQVARTTRADAGHVTRIRATWEDTPFYSRTALATRFWGEPVHAVHESLSLDRFRSGIVQWMLPWRMPRRL
ncbi:carotenoid 1,2-hydratase [Polymorphobacter multimanifer]|nr:carotenoid 1,2-hydratase [Polymorphobacter multimanifer]